MTHSCLKRCDKILVIVILIMGLVGAAGVHLVLPRLKRGAEAVIDYGEPRRSVRVSLQEEGTYVFDGPVGRSVVEVKAGKIHMLHSDCPDKICMKMGWIDKPGQIVVCLPNRVFIRVVDSE